MAVSRKDRQILRDLAAEVAGIAALPVQQETIARHKALNGLRPVRPMVMIDQVCWHEMNVDDELTPRCEDKFCRDVETRLRRTLYQWKHMRADMVVEPAIDVLKVIRGMGFGMRVVEETAVTDPANNIVGHFFMDQLANEEDVAKIRMPEVSLDEKATAALEEKARGIFDGLLDVRMRGWYPMFAPWDRIVQWRGAEALLMDMALRPEHTHRIIRRLTDALTSMLDQLEAQGLLWGPMNVIHCTGAWTDELPASPLVGGDPCVPPLSASRATKQKEGPHAGGPLQQKAADSWTMSQAQIFSTVSPAMHDEFEIEYSKDWYARFGLGYYGCCEPLDDKIDVIRKLPNVRKISMSPWVDVERGAERIGRNYVFSRKPAPALLAGEWNPDAVQRDLRRTVDACARHGCPCELILKDISTVCYEPQRLWEWEKIARRVVGG